MVMVGAGTAYVGSTPVTPFAALEIRQILCQDSCVHIRSYRIDDHWEWIRPNIWQVGLAG